MYEILATLDGKQYVRTWQGNFFLIDDHTGWRPMSQPVFLAAIVNAADLTDDGEKFIREVQNANDNSRKETGT